MSTSIKIIIKDPEISIAILDTGFDAEHIDFKQGLLYKDFCGSRDKPEDLDGHGSHLTGIIMGKATNARLLLGRAMTHSYLVAHNPLIQGIEWAKSNKVDIILITAGFKTNKKEIERVVMEALDANVLIVAAIGNNGEAGENAGYFPARYPGVVGVGSVNAKGEISDFSDQCQELDILAPGENISSFYLNGEMVEGSGTSQAAANVAGAVANIIEAYKSKHIPYNAKSIIELLQRTGGSTMPSSEFKIIDQEAALKAIRED